MGSKRSMLRNGLGEALERAVVGRTRFVDMFSGSAAVSWHVAERFALPVLATDLQEYAVALAKGVLTRTSSPEDPSWIEDWIGSANAWVLARADANDAELLQQALGREEIAKLAVTGQQLSAETDVPFCRAYGGWYYSPWQALSLHSLRCAAEETPYRDVAVASVVEAASECAASPGHTAQPFKTDTRAAPFVVEAWSRDPLRLARRAAEKLAAKHALVLGDAVRARAEDTADALHEGDLVFLDPPYSAVHYSRFYHVLESLARGNVGEVSGRGRYPSRDERPQSSFSIATQADAAFYALMTAISGSGAHAMVTFPAGQASNGLSGDRVREVAADLFHIEEEKVSSRFSTLGGDKRHRSARQDAEELILLLRPKRS